jgi:predicted transcriptional regulator of viral defense system
VGHRILSTHGRWMAAVLAGGPGAVLSHRPAAELSGILPPSQGSIHVTVPRKLHPRRGLTFHRARLPEDEVDCVDRIPVTGLSRTLLDLAACGLHEVERALYEAEVKRLTDRLSLDDLIAR